MLAKYSVRVLERENRFVSAYDLHPHMRVSTVPRRSLGWIPFKASAVQYKNGQVHLAGTPLSLWDSYGLAQYELGPGSISEDAIAPAL